MRLRRVLELRAPGTETSLEVELATPAEIALKFRAEFVRRFGFAPPADDPQVATLRAEAIVEGERQSQPFAAAAKSGTRRSARAWFDGWRDVALIDRDDIAERERVAGPALIVEPNSTTVVEPGWTGERLEDGSLRLFRQEPIAAAPAAAGRPDPAQLELFNHRFMQVAEQMGAVLQSTAVSVNIRERLDFSCALFDAEGALIANAPHMPVHLGSMGASVRAVIAANRGQLRPGRAWMLNAPYAGGTHLPDITVVSPVFVADEQEPSFFVASRAHHADIGGITPGSMPPASRTIAEEGVLFDNFLLLDEGNFREHELRVLLAAGPWPARNPDQNVADLKAQLAANARGLAELESLIARCGRETVVRYMAHVQDNAEACVREVIGRLGDGHLRYEMDDGSAIEVTVTVDRERRSAIVDFAGTSPQQAGNFNAPFAVCTAAVLYVFRTLVDADFPLNEGCLRPLSIRVAKGSMLNPVAPAAVVAGNVETSQCVVDALFGALGVLAASQGTMNNLTFGDAGHQYYETIAGGAGAGPGFDGASGVQTHMTNSRLTDPEVLETRHPVLLREFRYRRGSGGAGRHRGGDGLVRRIAFREPMTVAILSNHRRIAPFGLAGAAAGATGINRLDAREWRIGRAARLRERRGRSGRRNRDRDAGRRRIRLDAFHGRNVEFREHLREARVRQSREIRADRPHAASARPVAHDVGVESAGALRRKSEHQVHDALLAQALAVDALVAEHEPAIALLAVRERAALFERAEEIAHLLGGAVPGRLLVRLEHHPARAALDAVDDQERKAPGRERTPVGRNRAGARERADERRFASGTAHGLHRVDARGREANALFIVDRAGGPQAGAQDRFLAAGGRPDRPVLRCARERAGNRARRREGLEAAAQLVVAEQARKEHAGGVGWQRPVPHFRDRLRRAVPADRRIDEQQRAPLAAEPVRDEERARADVDLAGKRRNAEQVESIGRIERKEARALRRGSDDVVIGERRAVVRIRAGEHVTRDPARIVARRRIGTERRQFARDPGEFRTGEHGRDRSRRIRRDREPAIDLLVFDVFRTGRPHALDHQVEQLVLVVADAVVVDGRAQELARAGRERLEHELLAARRQFDRAAARAVRDAHDDRRATAVLEELLDRIRERARLPEAAEDALEFVESGNRNRTVDRSTQATADECRDGRRRFRDRLPRAGFFLNLDAGQSFRHG